VFSADVHIRQKIRALIRRRAERFRVVDVLLGVGLNDCFDFGLSPEAKNAMKYSTGPY